jgi:hypothetical protein
MLQNINYCFNELRLCFLQYDVPVLLSSASLSEAELMIGNFFNSTIGRSFSKRTFSKMIQWEIGMLVGMITR